MATGVRDKVRSMPRAAAHKILSARTLNGLPMDEGIDGARDKVRHTYNYFTATRLRQKIPMEYLAADFPGIDARNVSVMVTVLFVSLALSETRVVLQPWLV